MDSYIDLNKFETFLQNKDFIKAILSDSSNISMIENKYDRVTVNILQYYANGSMDENNEQSIREWLIQNKKELFNIFFGGNKELDKQNNDVNTNSNDNVINNNNNNNKFIDKNYLKNILNNNDVVLKLDNKYDHSFVNYLVSYANGLLDSNNEKYIIDWLNKNSQELSNIVESVGIDFGSQIENYATKDNNNVNNKMNDDIERIKNKQGFIEKRQAKINNNCIYNNYSRRQWRKNNIINNINKVTSAVERFSDRSVQALENLKIRFSYRKNKLLDRYCSLLKKKNGKINGGTKIQDELRNEILQALNNREYNSNMMKR